jgi:hypothetical protein
MSPAHLERDSTVAESKVSTKKPAAKLAVKSATKAPTKPASGPFEALIASALTGPVDREAIRAARYPKAAAQEAARKEKAQEPKAGGLAVKRASYQNGVPFSTAVVKPGAKFYGIAASERPSKGAQLYAHTHAVLGAFGMFATPSPAVPSGNLVTLMGNTAVSYHITQRNLERAPGNCIRMTAAGRDFFNKRLVNGQFDTVQANAIASLIVTGKASKEAGVSQSAVFSHQP